MPGLRSMVQSYGRCGGRKVAQDLRKTSPRSWYSRFGASSRRGAETGAWALSRQRVEQNRSSGPPGSTHHPGLRISPETSPRGWTNWRRRGSGLTPGDPGW